MNDHQRYVLTFGPKTHRRCKIVDRNLGTWTGDNWSNDSRNARLYLDFQTAAHDLQMIELFENYGEPSTTYRGTVEVTVVGHSQQQMDLQELREYLVRATKLSLTKAAPNGETVLVNVDWDELV